MKIIKISIFLVSSLLCINAMGALNKNKFNSLSKKLENLDDNFKSIDVPSLKLEDKLPNAVPPIVDKVSTDFLAPALKEKLTKEYTAQANKVNDARILYEQAFEALEDATGTMRMKNLLKAKVYFLSLKERFGITTSNKKSLFYLGEIHMVLKEYKKAIKFYSEFLTASQPTDSREYYVAWLKIANAYYNDKNLDRACQIMDNVLKDEDSIPQDILKMMQSRSKTIDCT